MLAPSNDLLSPELEASNIRLCEATFRADSARLHTLCEGTNGFQEDVEAEMVKEVRLDDLPGWKKHVLLIDEMESQRGYCL